METVDQTYRSNEDRRRWYAVFTGFRKEKSVYRELAKYGIEAYVPVIKKVRQYRRKVKEYELPLISHYVFVRIHQSERSRVLNARDVFRFVGFGGRPSPIPEEEIALLQRITGEINEVEAMPLQDLNEGSEVEVIGGALTGLRGTVRSKTGKHRLLIDLKNIGYTLSLEVPAKYLRILKRA